MSNNIPKTTKLTLKRIVENLDRMPSKMSNNGGFGQEAKKLTPEQKQRLMELTSMFESFGECLNNEEALMSTAKSITELCELAETYAINECGDWFQQDIVKRDMNEIKKRVGEFQKVTKEAYARMQQLGVAYQDLGHVLGRYFSIDKNKGSSQQYPEPQSGEKQPLQMDEAGKRVCFTCQKDMGEKEDLPDGDVSHGICPDCFDKWKNEDPMLARRQPDSDMANYMGDGDRS